MASFNHPTSAMMPLLARLDRQYGGPWSRLDIDARARDAASVLGAVPLPALTLAVDWLLAHHEGHYPKLAYIRRIGLERARTMPGAAQEQGEDDRCPSCGEVPGWHTLARPKLPAQRPGPGWSSKWMIPTVTRLITRHRAGFPCTRFNDAYTFAVTGEEEGGHG